jgi:acetylornithine deacetylase/succinyl-diaminopimelate desuccinylase-like protein
MKLLASCCLLVAAPALAQERYPVDWRKLEPEIVERFSELIRIDTSNPPGNETRAAKWIQAVLERDGIPSRLFATDPQRANLVARMKGNGSKRPILVMGHTDVVGVQREKWSVDPFAAIRKDEFIYGRGAVDDKDHVIAGMMLLLMLKRMDVKLDRDVIFLAEAGEESSTSVGIDFMVSNHWSEIEAEYALAEGGSIAEQGGKVRHVMISTTEKVPRGIRLVARGTAGHGSRPLQDNSVLHLAAAVAKAGAWQTPMRLNDTTRAYFERLAGISTPQQAARYRALLSGSRAAEVQRYLAQNEPGHYSILRTSIAPTILKAGFRSNVIPSEAEAYLDVRALPDEDMPRFLSELTRVIGDGSIEIVPPRASRPAAPPSRIDSEMFRALERVQRRMFPEAVTLPGMLTGATDMAQLRARGVQAYGFGSIVTAENGPVGGAHGDDERIPVRSLQKLVEFLWYSVLEVAATR